MNIISKNGMSFMLSINASDTKSGKNPNKFSVILHLAL